MVDEPVVQTEADTPQAEPVAPEEPVAASEAVEVSDGESVAPEVLTEPVVETIEPTSPTTVEELRAQFPDLAKAVENAGAQSREATLKREAGSREQTRQRVETIMRKHNIEVEDPAELYYAWDLASANSKVDAIRDTVTGFGALFGDSEVGPLLMEKFEASASMADLEANGKMVAERAVDHALTVRLLDLDGADVTEETAPKLHKWIQDEVVRRQELEMAADKIAPAQDSPPATSQGQTVGASGVEDPAESYAAASRAFNEGRITSAEYGELRTKFGLGRR